MRKFITLAAISVLVIAAAYFSSCKGKESDTATGDNKEDSVKKVVERGRYLANHVTPCLDCHSTRDFKKYGGPIVPGTEGMGGEVFNEVLGIPGVVYAKNITPDNETGIGTWTDDEIMRAMTHGISKTGDTLFPIMPYAHFNHMSKDDLQSIVAYLRTLKPIRNKVADRKLMIPMSMAYPAPALAPTVDNNKRPPESDIVNYGGYLVNAAVCSECHTPMLNGQPDFSKSFAGGFVFDMGLFKVTASNITPDSATGIGTWTEERFMNKFTQYREEKNYNFDPGKQNTIMPVACYANMTDSDLKAVFAYLKTLKPISNKVEKYPQ